MQIHAPCACIAIYKPGWPEKGVEKTKCGNKKAAVFSGRGG